MVAAAVLLLVFLPLLRRAWRALAIAAAVAWVLAIGFARITLGVHYVSDVLAGYALGAAWVAAMIAVFNAWRRERGRPPADPAQGLEPGLTPVNRGVTARRPAIYRVPRRSSASTPRPPRKEAVMQVSHRITRLVAVGIATAAIAAPAASARPVAPDSPSSGEPVYVGPVSLDEGFDWASAAIGAGGAGALILLVSAGGVSYRHRHEHIGIAR